MTDDERFDKALALAQSAYAGSACLKGLPLADAEELLCEHIAQQIRATAETCGSSVPDVTAAVLGMLGVPVLRTARPPSERAN